MYLTMETITNYLVANSELSNKEVIFCMVSSVVFGMVFGLILLDIKHNKEANAALEQYRRKESR